LLFCKTMPRWMATPFPPPQGPGPVFFSRPPFSPNKLSHLGRASSRYFPHSRVGTFPFTARMNRSLRLASHLARLKIIWRIITDSNVPRICQPFVYFSPSDEKSFPPFVLLVKFKCFFAPALFTFSGRRKSSPPQRDKTFRPLSSSWRIFFS